MSDYVKMNLSKMFDTIDPWDCSNSVANLGPQAARLTWQEAMSVAGRSAEWLLGSTADAVEAVRDWARDAGAWDQDEIESWDDNECLALLVQNVAGDLRELGADDMELVTLPRAQSERYERDEDTTRTELGHEDGAVIGTWYGGM